MTTYKPDLVRIVTFTPYREGCGPQFRLELYDVGQQDRYGKNAVGYRLLQNDEELFSSLVQEQDTRLYSPDAVDSDEAVLALMDFLCLKPGDTDADWFEDYSARQIEFTEEHAEALHWEVYCLFGGDE